MNSGPVERGLPSSEAGTCVGCTISVYESFVEIVIHPFFMERTLQSLKSSGYKEERQKGRKKRMTRPKMPMELLAVNGSLVHSGLSNCLAVLGRVCRRVLSSTGSFEC